MNSAEASFVLQPISLDHRNGKEGRGVYASVSDTRQCVLCNACEERED